MSSDAPSSKLRKPIATNQSSFSKLYYTAKRKASVTDSQVDELPVDSAPSQLPDIDLVGATTNLINFLKAVDTFPKSLYEGPALLEAVRRYERLWLPMIIEYEKRKEKMAKRIQNQQEERKALSSATWLWEGIQIPSNDHWDFHEKHKYGPLVPPLDIAWVWYLHRLDSKAYSDFCSYAEKPVDAGGDGQGGGSVKAALAFDNGRYRDSHFTRVVWSSLYPDERFYPPTDRESAAKVFAKRLEETEDNEIEKQASLQKLVESNKSKMDYISGIVGVNFEHAAQIQRKFFKQILVRWNFYENRTWLTKTIERYSTWMQLQSDMRGNNPEAADKLLAPYDIALMWHAHLACNWSYRKFCLRVLGAQEPIPHHPVSSDDRKAENVMERVQFTKDEWKKFASGDVMRMGAPLVPNAKSRMFCNCFCGDDKQDDVWGPQKRAGFEKTYQKWWIEGEYTHIRCTRFGFLWRLLFFVCWFTAAVVASYYSGDCIKKKLDYLDEDAGLCDDYTPYILWPAMFVGVFCYRPFFTTCCVYGWGRKRFKEAIGRWDLPHSSRHPFWDFPKEGPLPFQIVPSHEHYGEDPSRIPWWCPLVSFLAIFATVVLLAHFVQQVQDDLAFASMEVVSFVVWCANELASSLVGLFDGL